MNFCLLSTDLVYQAVLHAVSGLNWDGLTTEPRFFKICKTAHNFWRLFLIKLHMPQCFALQIFRLELSSLTTLPMLKLIYISCQQEHATSVNSVLGLSSRCGSSIFCL